MHNHKLMHGCFPSLCIGKYMRVLLECRPNYSLYPLFHVIFQWVILEYNLHAKFTVIMSTHGPLQNKILARTSTVQITGVMHGHVKLSCFCPGHGNKNMFVHKPLDGKLSTVLVLWVFFLLWFVTNFQSEAMS